MRKLCSTIILLAITSNYAIANESPHTIPNPYMLNESGLAIAPDIKSIIKAKKNSQFKLSALYPSGKIEQNCVTTSAKKLFREIDSSGGKTSFRMIVLRSMRDVMFDEKFSPDFAVVCYNQEAVSASWENMIKGINGDSFAFEKAANNSIGTFFFGLFPDGAIFFLPPLAQ